MTENSSFRIGGLLLAAGGSRRLGRPKQLLEFQGMTLLRRSAEAIVESECSPSVVVLGAEVEGSKSEIEDLEVSLAVNENWAIGMSSSIRVGLEKLFDIEPEIDAVMITLCDQPFVTAEMIMLFIEAFKQKRVAIVAAQYNSVLGVPALFSREMLGPLSEVEGDKGARDLIRQTESTFAIDLPEAAIDIDTIQDLDDFKSRN